MQVCICFQVFVSKTHVDVELPKQVLLLILKVIWYFFSRIHLDGGSELILD